MRPNKLSFLYCRERKHGLMGVHVYACISEGSGDTTGGDIKIKIKICMHTDEGHPLAYGFLGP